MSSRENQAFGPYGEYPTNEVAGRYGASDEQTFPESEPSRYRDGWLPGS